MSMQPTMQNGYITATKRALGDVDSTIGVPSGEASASVKNGLNQVGIVILLLFILLCHN
jgi:hypothetical protein